MKGKPGDAAPKATSDFLRRQICAAQAHPFSHLTGRLDQDFGNIRASAAPLWTRYRRLDRRAIAATGPAAPLPRPAVAKPGTAEGPPSRAVCAFQAIPPLEPGRHALPARLSHPGTSSER